MKTQLSSILPVSEACRTLGEDRVQNIVYHLLSLQRHNAPRSNSSTSGGENGKDELWDEARNLTQAMLYSTNTTMVTTSESSKMIPPPIRQAWKTLASRPLLLDKTAFIKFLVPACAQPHPGPGGHMGLYDCLVYALQQKQSASPTALPAATGPPMGPPLVALPDILIMLAVNQNYRDLQIRSEKQETLEGITKDHSVILAMAKWMFVVYDGYQKKGVVSRDTLHRFLSDVHGEDSYKALPVRNLLDACFARSLTLTSQEFVEVVQETILLEPYPSHTLLDWMAVLAMAMMPPVSGVAKSTTTFLKKIDMELRLLPQICQEIGLAESRLFEIKRRYHSLVEASSEVIQGDPMREESTDIVREATVGNNHSRQLPKHVISKPAFCKALCYPNDELGHGGYLPKSVANKVFAAEATADQYWDLQHVLQFGGTTVRSDDASLVRWMVRMATQSKDHEDLDRSGLAILVQCLCRHWSFRRAQDSRTADGEFGQYQENDGDKFEATILDADAVRSLDLLPAEAIGDDVSQIHVDTIVDHLWKTLCPDGELIKSPNVLLEWHNAETSAPKDRRRLGPFLVELRLISSVLFGIPPRLASMEYAIINELQRRHKHRYPQTDLSRRGPRGTIWYLIDDLWYRTWSGTVKRVSLTAEDAEDQRDKPTLESTPRRLGRISNTALLRENGSLALRVDIKWRQDYEILPPLAWSALQAWYDGGPPIHRSVVKYIPSTTTSPHARGAARPRTENEVELYPHFVTVFMCDASSRGEARPFQQTVPVSRVSPLRVLLVQLCKGLDIDPKYGRLWVMPHPPAVASRSSSFSSQPTDDQVAPSHHEDWLLDLEYSIMDQRSKPNGIEFPDKLAGTTLLLEIKDDETGLWPRGTDGKTWSFRDSKDPLSDTGDGIVGLYNMGNTCYLNASIQCLSHTPIFREYFISKCYLNDINSTNPLGYQGRLAQVSAVLINSLWKRHGQQQANMPKRVIAPDSYAPVNAPSLTPKTFKDSLGKFSDHFSGNEQHDAQELLAFVLGGLSEDLNRILDKPYIEAPDSDGRPDKELADIWWSNHLKREMSIIVALFTGQYRSLLTCRSCNYESARFEPFSFLQLPLPEDDHITVYVVLYPTTPSTDTMKYALRVKNNGNLFDVLVALCRVLFLDEQHNGSQDRIAFENDSKLRVNDEKADEFVARCEARARNMAVVDMRDSYIFKIAPNSWTLPDLQNKDTGELPLLHVFELDPLPDVDGRLKTLGTGTSKGDQSTENDSVDETVSGSEDEAEVKSSSAAHVAVAQRRSEQLSSDLLHPLSHRVFGTPLLLRIDDLESFSGRSLYDLVAQKLRNFVPKGALKFLESVKDAGGATASMEKNTEATKKEESRQKLQKTTTDMEEVASGPLPRYGFRLRISTRDGRRCALCPWYECCIGCFVPDDDSATVVMSGDSIVVDWHLAVDVATSGFGSRATQAEQAGGTLSRARSAGVTIKNHPSCGVGAKQKGYVGAITLEDCLDQFAKEEKIPEAYCSKCKDFRVQTKTMSLWRLPPIVIIQLKRFQFTQHMRRKLRDFVAFPIEGLDLSRIMAPDTEEDEGAGVSGIAPEEDLGIHGIEDEKKLDSLVSSVSGRSEILYDLYGVVHHQGALSGGHYVASLKSEIDGQWRLFNDAQVYEIHSQDVVDSSAYILFYIRRDVKGAKLSDFWDTSPHRPEGENPTEEDIDKLIRGRSERCTIS